MNDLADSTPQPITRPGLDAGYLALRDELRARGCFTVAPWRSVVSLPLHVALAMGCFALSARLVTDVGVLAAPVAVAVFVVGSFFFYRLGWLMHDAAHGGVFAGARANHAFASLTAAILGEFPSGWRYGHNRHHAAPNVRGRDFDQSERWDPSRRYRSAVAAAVNILFFSTYKGVTLPKTLLLLGLRDGYFCFTQSRATFRRELMAVLLSFVVQNVVFAAIFGVVGPVLWIGHTMIGMLYLNTAFAGNHYDKDTFSEDEARLVDFAALQIRTSRNYRGGLVAHYVFGGLEKQIEHHLFPSMPRHHLHRAAPVVRAFCEARGLAYDELDFASCVARVVRFHVDSAGDEPATA